MEIICVQRTIKYLRACVDNSMNILETSFSLNNLITDLKLLEYYNNRSKLTYAYAILSKSYTRMFATALRRAGGHCYQGHDTVSSCHSTLGQSRNADWLWLICAVGVECSWIV